MIIPQGELLCKGCQALIYKGHPRTWNWNMRRVWCLKCLEQMPDAPFCVRLKTFRLSLGMSQKELAERADVPLRSIQFHEQYVANPKWQTLVKLVRVLGSGLVCA
jgi:DNA-binding XRE family transcriptional regulator